MTNVVGGLLDLAGEQRAWKELIRGKVASLKQLATTDDFGVSREQALVRVYVEAMRDSERSLTSLARLDLDTRIVRIAEAQANAWADVLDRVLDAELDADSAGRVRLRFGREVRQLVAAKPEEL